jgi:transcriptional regulator with XRE-family HTH domain
MKIDRNALGAAIKSVRMARGLTQAKLAAGLGFSSGSVALIEQGKRSVSMASLNAIAKALDIPPACLAILGSHGGAKSKAVADFMASLKSLVSALVNAQGKLAGDAKTVRGKKGAAGKHREELALAVEKLAPHLSPDKSVRERSGSVLSHAATPKR